MLHSPPNPNLSLEMDHWSMNSRFQSDLIRTASFERSFFVCMTFGKQSSRYDHPNAWVITQACLGLKTLLQRMDGMAPEHTRLALDILPLQIRPSGESLWKAFLRIRSTLNKAERATLLRLIKLRVVWLIWWIKDNHSERVGWPLERLLYYWVDPWANYPYPPYPRQPVSRIMSLRHTHAQLLAPFAPVPTVPGVESQWDVFLRGDL
jgi:hypothetical protein